MIKEEWKALRKNKLLLIVIFVIALIPALYNLIFLGAMWDPYGKLDKLPVAVVNDDHSVAYQGKQLALGDQLSMQLKEKQSLDFHFVTNKTAQEKLKAGKYYMIVKIPADFSKTATTLLTDHPKQMTIDYQTSKGSNLTASKMSDSAITELKSKVSTEVTQMYTNALLTQFKATGKGMGQAATGEKKLASGTDKLKAASGTITDKLDQLATSSLTFSEGSQNLTVGLKQYVDGVSGVDAGAKKLNSGLTTLSGNLPELTQGMGQLRTGSENLATGIDQYTAGVSSVATGSNKLQSGINQLQTQLPTLSNGVNELSTGADKLNSGVGQYVAGTGELASGSQKVTTGLNQLADQTKALPTQVQTLHAGTQKLAASVQKVQMSDEQKNQLLDYTKNVDNYVTQVSSLLGNVDLTGLQNTGQAQQAIGKLSAGLTTLQQSISQTNQQVAELKQAAAAHYEQDLTTNAAAIANSLASQGVNLTAEQKASILTTMKQQNSQTLTGINQFQPDFTGLNQLVEQEKSGLDQLNQALAALQNVPTEKLSTLKSGADQLASHSQAATAGIEQVLNGMSSLSTSLVPAVQAIDQGVAQFDTKMPQLTSGINQLAAGSQQVSQGADQLVSKGSALTSGTAQLTTGLKTMQQKTPALTSGVSELATGAKQLNAGSQTLNQKSAALNQGANQLTTGLQSASGKLPTMTSGVAQLVSGSNQLAAGTDKLVSNSDQLLNGSGQLTDGAKKIADGSGQLATGEKQVNSSLGTVQAGLGTLTDKLASGAHKISQLNTNQAASQAIATPVKSSHTDHDHVKNNGTAMAPYMMSVALFVGTLTFNMLFDTFTPKKKPTSGIAWWASKLSVLALVSFLQASFVYFVLRVILGMSVLAPFKVFAFLFLVSLTFMSIVTLANLVLGKLGSFVMLLFMILQLAGSGGTYPIQLSNKFYETISPFLPMTYSIRALREGISIGGSMSLGVWIFIGLLVISNGLMIAFFTKKQRDPKALAGVGDIVI